MARVRLAYCTSLSAALLLLAGSVSRVGAQQTRDANLTVSATVLAAAPRVERADARAISCRASGANEREVQLIVTAGTSSEGTVSLVPRTSGVTIELIASDGSAIVVGASGVRVARTNAGVNLSVPVLLRLRSADHELLLAAAAAPVLLQVESASR